jgi:hypothetical protein
MPVLRVNFCWYEPGIEQKRKGEISGINDVIEKAQEENPQYVIPGYIHIIPRDN